MCSKKQKGYTTALKMIHRFAFKLAATVKQKKEKRKGRHKPESNPYLYGWEAIHVHS